MNRILSLALIALLMGACIPKKDHDVVVAEQKRLEAESKDQQLKIEKLTGRTDALDAENGSLKREIEGLKADTAALGGDIRKTNERIAQLNGLINDLVATNETISNNSMAENARLARELKQNELLVKKKEAELETLAKSLAATQKDLEAREKKVKELQATLSRKDSVVNALQQVVAKALLGFQNSGLTVVQKNGKVYVSLSEQLLFGTGSATVDPRGKQAIQELGKVLEANPDISILVEGHTDDQGSDELNWDLSVRRATSIVKILAENNKIDPSRLTAAGRGKHLPLDPAKNADARRKNRRTEIILTPRLDDLFRIIESN
jgi:chemotaxis protein MotB